MALIVCFQHSAQSVQISIQNGIIVNCFLALASTNSLGSIQFFRNLIYAISKPTIIIFGFLCLIQNIIPERNKGFLICIQSHLCKVCGCYRIAIRCIKAEFVTVVSAIGTVKRQALVLVGQTGVEQTRFQELRVMCISIAAIRGCSINILSAAFFTFTFIILGIYYFWWDSLRK